MNHPFARLNLPPVQLDIRPAADAVRGDYEVYDRLRRRWVVLTPEEWVRQHFVAFLCNERGYPAALIANEIGIKLNGTLRRCDTVVYSRHLKPLVIVEYKAPTVAVTQKVFDQIARYNSVLCAPYLIVSNGLGHYCCRFGGDGYAFLPDIPDYAAVSQEIQNM